MSTVPGDAAAAHPETTVLLAAPDLAVEPRLVADLARGRHGVRIGRRCVDAVDVVAAASAGLADTALIGAALPRLTADAVAALRTGGLHVIGLCDADDDAARLRFLALGIDRLIEIDERAVGVPGNFAAQVRAALPGAPGREVPTSRAGNGPDRGAGVDVPRGRLIAVWGPSGAPGRTSVAVGIGDELSRLGAETLLVDADTRGPALTTLLGVVEEVSGIAVACRQADAGSLTVEALAQAARALSPTFRILTGLPDDQRWRELREASLERVWATGRRLCDAVVADVGFDLGEPDGGLLDRGAAARTAVGCADEVVVVGVAEPLGIERLLGGLDRVRAARPGLTPKVVVTRVRRATLGRDPEGQIREVLRREAGVDEVALIPDDRRAYDACLREGRTLSEAAPRSPARTALQAVARSLRDGLLGPGPEPVGDLVPADPA